MLTKFEYFLRIERGKKEIDLFLDIETFQYNELKGREKPSEFKNMVYSVAVSYLLNDKIEILRVNNFRDFFDLIFKAYENYNNHPNINLVIHNGNKYDNHFLLYDLKYFYDIQVENLYLLNATDEGNILTRKKKEITNNQKKEGILLEKRIKSSINLEIEFYKNNIHFKTIDNYLKTNTSIANLGKKLKDLNLITDEELKTDFNYQKYNKDYNMTDEEARKYSKKIFNNLDKDEIRYIDNDVIILLKSVYYYSDIFKGFSYDEITFTRNILNYYNNNDLTSYQLLKKVGKGKDSIHVKYTDYFFNNQNFYDYLKSFYSGGLNLYNDSEIGKIINDEVIALDINSSYPYVMHNFKVPTYLNEYEEFNERTEIVIPEHDENYYSLYRMTKNDFDKEVVIKIKSINMRKAIVKYYNSLDFININSYTIKLLRDIFKIDIKSLTILSYVTFKNEYFGSRDLISEKYEIKERGSSKYILEYKSPYDIKETDKINKEKYTREEIDISKVILNGLYGIPALRSHFNIFRNVNEELVNVPNGYKNNERNIAFSVFVTSVSLYNLLYPLKDLTPSEIDENFLYCDTDSLFLKKKIFKKIDKNILNPHHLGKWDIDNANIKKFYILNHKKYAYEDEAGIAVKSAGVPNNSFNFSMRFEEFIETQFSPGVKIKNTKSIYTNMKTISIYESETELDLGAKYSIFTELDFYDNQMNEMLEEIRNSDDVNMLDILYIESNLGTLSFNDIFPIEHEKGKKPLLFLRQIERTIKQIVNINN